VNALLARGCLLACLMLAASGCTGSLFESKQAVPQVYLLKPTPMAAGSDAKLATSLSVAALSVTPGLDTTRIALLREGTQLDFYAGARWGDTAPQVVQTFIVALLQDSADFLHVTSEQARVDSDYLLDLELRDFQAEYRGAAAPPVVHVSLVANLVRIQTRKSLSLLHANAAVPAAANNLTAVIAAFQSATQQASESLVQQVRTALSSAAP
jgi:cholesterol transport system auxiliary component